MLLPQAEDCRESGERAVGTSQDKEFSCVLPKLLLSIQKRIRPYFQSNWIFAVTQK